MWLRTEPELIWIALKKKNECAAIQRKLDLTKSLLDLNMSEGFSVLDYLHVVERHVTELGCVGESVSDQELIQIVLQNLPNIWYDSATFANLEEYI